MLSVGPYGYAFGFGLFAIYNDIKYDEKNMVYTRIKNGQII
ncbi:MAG: hypothetical protein ACI35S_01665 [Anaeroplasma sp.]